MGMEFQFEQHRLHGIVEFELGFEKKSNLLGNGIRSSPSEPSRDFNLPHSRSFLVSTWYRTPSAETQLFDEYEKFVQHCDIEHEQLILIGDINSDYAKTPR